LKYHKVSKLFPLMPDDELKLLQEDIDVNGQREPIVLHPDDDSIIDGRNRYRACKELGRDVEYVHWDKKGSLVAYVVSLNLHRRHLSASQRAMIAVDILPMLEKENPPGRPKKAERKGGTNTTFSKNRDTAATITGASARYVSDAKKIVEEEPELAEQVRSGEKTITQAKRDVNEKKRAKKRSDDKKRVAKVAKPEELDGVYSTILIDPPWDYADQGDNDPYGRTRPTYNQMSFEEIKKLGIEKKAAKNAHLYLWITNRALMQGFGWTLCEEWGFRPITLVTWCKPSIGVGNYFRNNTEHLIFGVKGSLKLAKSNIGTWFEARRGPKGHSSKPPEIYSLIESCSPGPYLEFFSRTKRDGWVSSGAAG